MKTIELTLNQLSTIAGGVQIGPDGSYCTDRHLASILKKLMEGGSTRPFNPSKETGSSDGTNQIAGSADPGGDDI
ncbi:MAG: hypothetical protein GKR83_05335 [Synechococcus sp. s2_metabat2_7]|nr:hypothetical protein [Synechococcus sp. s2_metabat2_7]